MATPKVAAAMPRAVVTFTVDLPGTTGDEDEPSSVAEVAALAILAVEGPLEIERVHVRSVAIGSGAARGRVLIEKPSWMSRAFARFRCSPA
jgi:hypothetical protein